MQYIIIGEVLLQNDFNPRGIGYEEIKIREVIKGKIEAPEISIVCFHNSAPVGSKVIRFLTGPVRTSKQSIIVQAIIDHIRPNKPIYCSRGGMLFQDTVFTAVKWFVDLQRIFEPNERINRLLKGVYSNIEAIKSGCAEELLYDRTYSKAIHGAYPLFLDILQNENDETLYRTAALIMGTNGVKDAMEPLCRRINDPNPRICEYSAHALALLGDRRAIDCLKTAILPELSWENITGIEKIEAIRDSLQKLPKSEQIPFLIKHLHHLSDYEYHTSVYARRELSNRDKEELFSGVVMILEDTTCDAVYLQRAAVELLTQLDKEDAIEYLTKILADTCMQPSIRKHAVEMLRKLGDTAAIPALLEAAQSRESEIADAAKDAILYIEPHALGKVPEEKEITPEEDIDSTGMIKSIVSPSKYLVPWLSNGIVYLCFELSPQLKVETWKLSITNEIGEVVWTMKGQDSFPTKIAWDGRDNKRLFLELGKYYYRLEILARNGKKYQLSGHFVDKLEY